MHLPCVDDSGDGEDVLGQAQPLSTLADRAPSRSGTPEHPSSSREERARLLRILGGGGAKLLLLSARWAMLHRSAAGDDLGSGASVVPLQDIPLRELNCKY